MARKLPTHITKQNEWHNSAIQERASLKTDAVAKVMKIRRITSVNSTNLASSVLLGSHLLPRPEQQSLARRPAYWMFLEAVRVMIKNEKLTRPRAARHSSRTKRIPGRYRDICPGDRCVERQDEATTPRSDTQKPRQRRWGSGPARAQRIAKDKNQREAVRLLLRKRVASSAQVRRVEWHCVGMGETHRKNNAPSISVSRALHPLPHTVAPTANDSLPTVSSAFV